MRRFLNSRDHGTTEKGIVEADVILLDWLSAIIDLFIGSSGV
jgi:hypothetical protein